MSKSSAALRPTTLVLGAVASVQVGASVAKGLAVATLSSAIPYSLELEALRRLPARVFGVLMTLEPDMAALAGYVVLGEVLGPGRVKMGGRIDVLPTERPVL